MCNEFFLQQKTSIHGFVFNLKMNLPYFHTASLCLWKTVLMTLDTCMSYIQNDFQVLSSAIIDKDNTITCLCTICVEEYYNFGFVLFLFLSIEYVE
jgi:hypothetical protein